MTRVFWTDVAPRDGVQTFPHEIPTAVKVRMVQGLLATGVPRVEAAAAVSPRWVPAMADGAEVIAALTDGERQSVRVLVPNLQGATTALSWGVKNLLLTIGATESFNHKNVNRTVADSLIQCQAIVQLAHAQAATVDVAISVAFGCPYEGHVDPHGVVKLVLELADRGVDEIGIADTIGVANPTHVRAIMAAAAKAVGKQRLSLHVHDTRGLGIANVLAAYEVGIVKFDGSLGGIGGCPFAPRSTGNVCSEDALIALEDAGAVTGCDLAMYCALSEELSETLGVEFPGRVYKAGRWLDQPLVAEENSQV